MDWNTAQRILCIRLDSLGDVLMTTPALAAIKASRPGCHLTLMTSAAGAAITPQLPMVDQAWVYDAPWLKASAPRASSQPEHDLLAELRRRCFDAAIIFTVYSQNPLPAATMAYLADIPLRLAHCRENPYQLLTDHIRDPEPELARHEVQRQLDLVASVGYHTPDPRLQLTVPAAAQQRIATLLAELGLMPQSANIPLPAQDPVGAQHAVPLQIEDVQLEANSDQPWIVIHPGASAPSRRYPPEHFAQVARSLATAGLTLLFTGTPPERDLVESIRVQIDAPTYSLVGLLDLADLSALLAAAPLLLSNNTGPVHIAAAVGTPVVDLYALTNLQHTPWQVPHRVLFHDVPCRLCYKSVCPEGHHACLRRVEPQTVVEAVLDLLASGIPKVESGARSPLVSALGP